MNLYLQQHSKTNEMLPKLSIPKWVKEHWHSQENDFNKLLDTAQKLRNKTTKLNNKQPIASAIIIAYNEEIQILNSISSLLSQETEFPYEIIVVNNNSTDRTQEIIDTVGVKSVFQEKQGHGHARSKGMHSAIGKFHITCDADSIYNPRHIDTMVKQLQKRNIAAVFGKHSFLPDAKISRKRLAVYEIFRDIIFNLRAINRPELCVGGAYFAYNAAFAKEVGWRTDLKRGEDGNLSSRLKKKGKLVHCRSFNVRIWTSSRRLNSDGGFFDMIQKRLTKEWKRRSEFLTKQKGLYKDRPENIIQKK